MKRFHGCHYGQKPVRAVVSIVMVCGGRILLRDKTKMYALRSMIYIWS